MPTLPKLRRRPRGVKQQKHVDRPTVVTGNFEFHYEDVIHRHSKMVIALFATGLIAVAIFIPRVVHQSVADQRYGAVEVETGKVSNPAFVSRVKGDISAGNNSYIEFSGLPCVQQPTTKCE